MEARVLLEWCITTSFLGCSGSLSLCGGSAAARAVGYLHGESCCDLWSRPCVHPRGHWGSPAIKATEGPAVQEAVDVLSSRGRQVLRTAGHWGPPCACAWLTPMPASFLFPASPSPQLSRPSHPVFPCGYSPLFAPLCSCKFLTVLLNTFRAVFLCG